ncbi:hypothetical protein AAHB64_01645 [Bacillus toyonensis]
MVSDLIQSAKINSSIYISFGEKSTKNYIESLNLDKLNLLYSYIPNLKVYKVLKQVQQNEIPSEMEAAYLDILKRYWGYDSYRSLKVYKNVDSLTNKKKSLKSLRYKLSTM